MSYPFPYTTLEEALKASVYFVEADSFSQYALWYIWHENPRQDLEPIPWKDVCKGWWRQLPVSSTCVDTTFRFIFGQLVCFYSTTSVKVDWNDVEAFLAPYWTDNPNDRRRKCDANNFHQCVGYCRKLSEK